jgi:hypothetical protein
MTEPRNYPVIRGCPINLDENGLVCLNDIWTAAGFSKNQSPSHWTQLAITARLISALLDRNAKENGISNYNAKSVFRTKRGQGGGTYAAIHLAVKYAEYLSPRLALEVADVFLRYKAADPTLAEDVLERATDEEALRVAQRTFGRVARNRYTDTLRDHGAKGPDYALCTDELYRKLFDAPSSTLRAKRGLPRKANVRDAMSATELAYVAAGEALSTERIEDENSQGGTECRVATGRSASFIRQAIEADRNDRRGRQGQLI